MSRDDMTDTDPARRRFFTIQLVRVAGVACVLLAMLIGAERIAAPLWLGYALLAAGLAGVFVLPPILVRKWRTPK
jgi:hypothetical protein